MSHTVDSKIDKNKVNNGISEVAREIAERHYKAQEYLDRKQSKRTSKRAAMFFGIICLLEYAAILWLIGR